MAGLYASALALILVVASPGTAPQEKFSGTIDGYDKPAAEVLAGMMVPYRIGVIDEQGRFTIPLNDEVISRVQEAIEQENQDSDEWTTRLVTTGRMFNCSNGNVAVTKTELPVIKLSTFGSYMIGNLEEQAVHGYFMATSSPAFAKAFNAMGQADAEEGHYLDWFYFAEPFSVSGSCGVETYAMNQEDLYVQTTSYDLDFEAGWNLVKYEVTEVFEDPDGTDMPMGIRYTTLDAVPDDIHYYFFE